MANDFDTAFEALRGVFADSLPKLAVAVDNDKEYTLHTQVANPLPRYKGAPVYFAGVKKGKAYVSLHFFPIYMHKELKDGISPDLLKRMQGMTCFNFKTTPDAKQIAELKKLIKAGLAAFKKAKWA